MPAPFTASPVALAGRLLLTSEDGDTFVVKAGPVHEVLRTDPIGSRCMRVSRENYDKLRRVQDLLRHQVPTGDVADIFDKALSLLLTAVEKKKLAAVERPRAGSSASARSRHIPASVKREVWQRDGGRCAFVGSEGRCEERGFLEFHHVEPYAAGRAVSVRNLELRCRAHNLFEAERFFGTRNPSLLREPPSEYVVY